MPALALSPARERQIKIYGSIAVALGVGGYVLLHKSSAAATTSSTTPAAIPADSLSGGDGSSGGAITAADLSSAYAAAYAQLASQQNPNVNQSTPVETPDYQQSGTPGTGNQISAGSPAGATSSLSTPVADLSSPSGASSYWTDISAQLAAMPASASVASLFPASAEVANSASPETQATVSEYQALVLGQYTPAEKGQPVDVSKGLTAADLQAQIDYLQGLEKAGAYNPNLAAISSQQAVSSLIASEQAALASGLYGTPGTAHSTDAVAPAPAPAPPPAPAKVAPSPTLAQVRAEVKAAHPNASTAAINATARKDLAVRLAAAK